MYTIKQIREAGADANIHAYYVEELIKCLPAIPMCIIEQKDKENQKRIITEIMHEDEQLGLYDS